MSPSRVVEILIIIGPSIKISRASIIILRLKFELRGKRSGKLLK